MSSRDLNGFAALGWIPAFLIVDEVKFLAG
jgi:hypothetical protein